MVNSSEPTNRRSGIEGEIITRAWKDEAFRRQLLDDPKGALKEAFGIELPAGMTLQVHEETANTLHMVLPMNPASLPASELRDEELEEVAGYASKSDPDPGTGYSDCHACVGGVRG